jgi:hypothetical protein
MLYKQPGFARTKDDIYTVVIHEAARRMINSYREFPKYVSDPEIIRTMTYNLGMWTLKTAIDMVTMNHLVYGAYDHDLFERLVARHDRLVDRQRRIERIRK